MKTSKKIISVVIALTLLVSTLAVAASFSSTAATQKVNFYEFSNLKLGNTHKSEGWYDNSWWGEGVTNISRATKDGGYAFSFEPQGGREWFQQANFDFTDVPAFEGKTVYIDVTNNSDQVPNDAGCASVKFKANYCDDSIRPTIAAGETATVNLTELIGDYAGGTLNIQIGSARGWLDVPAIENVIVVSALYTLEEVEETTAEPTTEEPVETTTEADVETTTEDTTADTTAETTTEATVISVPVSDQEFLDRAYDADAFNVTLGGEIEAKAGDIIEVTISLGNNPGIWSANFGLKYDDSILTPVDVEDDNVVLTLGDVLDDKMDGPITYTDDGYACVTVYCSNAKLEDHAEGDEGIGTTLATIRFQVSDDVEAGTYTKIAYCDYNDPFCNLDGEPVEATFQELTINFVEAADEDETTTEAADEDETTTAAADEDETTTAAADEDAATTTASSNSSSTSDDDDDVNTGAAAPIAALAVAAGAAFVAFKARKK